VGVVNHVLDRMGSQFYAFNEQIFSRHFLWWKFIEIFGIIVATGRPSLLSDEEEITIVLSKKFSKNVSQLDKKQKKRMQNQWNKKQSSNTVNTRV